MSTSFGSRRLVVGAHYGLRDWLAQRVTSLLMALFTIAVVVTIHTTHTQKRGTVTVTVLITGTWRESTWKKTGFH